MLPLIVNSHYSGFRWYISEFTCVFERGYIQLWQLLYYSITSVTYKLLIALNFKMNFLKITER